MSLSMLILNEIGGFNFGKNGEKMLNSHPPKLPAIQYLFFYLSNIYKHKHSLSLGYVA